MTARIENLRLALEDLREELRTTGYRRAMLREVASFYGLHPDLLARKFVEQNGAQLERFVAPAVTEEFEEAAAQADAEREARAWSGSADCAVIAYMARAIRALKGI
jgi:hypothetical protein